MKKTPQQSIAATGKSIGMVQVGAPSNEGASLPDQARIRSATRLDALDFVKGALVLFMVVYHSLNYSTDKALSFRYLAFLPPSFIIITGFLMAWAYFSRPAAADPATRRRLATRGIKLTLLFAMLNIAAGLAGRGTVTGQPLGFEYLAHEWFDVFVTGESRSAFEVLLPIGYLLLLGPLALAIYRWQRLLLPALALGIVAICKICESHGVLVSNGAMLGAGALGVFLGSQASLPLQRLSRLLPVTVVAYVGYAVLAARIGQVYLMQLTGALLALAILYGTGARIGNPGRLVSVVVRLGQYSLLSYIAQIGFLQILSRGFRNAEPLSVSFLLLFLSALALTILTAEVTEWGRKRYGMIDRAYRLVFG